MSKTKVFVFATFMERLEEDLTKHIIKLEEQGYKIKCISQILDSIIFKVTTTILYE